MNPIAELSPLFDVLGDYAPKARTFVVDMHDAQGVSCFQEFFPLVPPGMDDADVVRAIVRPLTAQGRTIDAVVELLGGCTYDEYNELLKRNPEAARKRFRPHFAGPGCR